MSLWAVLLTGLFAGGASCAAVQGGLLAGVVARHSRRSSEETHEREKQLATSTLRASAAEPAVPVAAFIAGKLVTHTALGALLGLVGDAVQLGVTTRASVQIAAGLLMVILALDLLGVSFVRTLVPRTPAAWGRVVRISVRSPSALAPAVLGAATVLIPCGVTLGMEFLAIASGSALSGAAIMAVFVLGTSPLFAAIGYAARRSATLLRGRLAVLAALAVFVAGISSVNNGLVLADSSLTLTSALRSVAGGSDQEGLATTAMPSDDGPEGIQRVVINAHNTGYSPALIRVRSGVPTELTVRTEGVIGCTRAFVIPSAGVERVLPATGDTHLDLGPLEPGRLRFTCAMGMYSGFIEAVE